jgi:hypothetical protein
MVITAATDNFLTNFFHILKGLLIYYQELQVSYGVLGNVFLIIGPEVQKPRLSSGGYDHLPLEKTTSIIIFRHPKAQSSTDFLHFFY